MMLRRQEPGFLPPFLLVNVPGSQLNYTLTSMATVRQPNAKMAADSSLSGALQNLSKLTGVFNDVIFVRKKNIFVYVTNPGTQALLKVGIKVSEGTTFLEEGEAISVPFAALTSALGKKSNAVVSLERDTLTVKDGRLVVELGVSTHTSSTSVVQPEGGVQLKLNTELSNFLNETLPKLHIEKIHPAQPDFRLLAMFGSKRTTLVTFDAHNMCFLSRPVTFEGVQGNFNLPYSRFTDLVKGSVFTDTTITATDDCLGLTRPGFSLVTLTPPQEGLTGDPSEIIKSKIQELKSFAGMNIKLKKESLLDYIRSIAAVAGDDNRVTGTIIKEGTFLELKTISSTGSSTTRLKLLEPIVDTEATGCAFDVRMLKSIAQKSDEIVDMCISKEEVLVNSKACTYVTTAVMA